MSTFTVKCHLIHCLVGNYMKFPSGTDLAVPPRYLEKGRTKSSKKKIPLVEAN